MTEATTSNYWISSTALYIELNAIGNPDYIQASCITDAKILVYVKDIIGYDAGHNYRRWSLQAAPTVFNSHTAKYVYFAIPKSEASDTPALVVFPSEKVDIYGKNASGKQIGDGNYYYIYSQGIISDSGTMGTTSRTWKAKVQTGTLSSDEAISAMGGEGNWWEYSSVDDTITFLKDIWKGTVHYLTVAKQIIFNGHTLTGVAEDGTDIESTQHIVTPKWGEDHWLSSVHDDEAEGIITFNAGLTSNGDINVYGTMVANAIHSHDYDDATESGYGFYKRKDGKWGMNITDLTIWGKAIFNQLTIRKLNAVDGNIVFSAAASKLSYVKPVVFDSVAGTVTPVSDDASANGWKCYLLADDGTMATTNSWAVDDQARCQTFDVAEGTYEGVSNKSYWRRVMAVSTSEQNEEITDAEGNVLFGGQKFAWIVLSKDDCDINSDVPAANDTIVLEGNRTDTDRQSLVIKETWGDDAPREIAYTGVNSYSFADKVVYEIGPKKVRFYTQYFELVTASGQTVKQTYYRGDYDASATYGYYDEVTYNGTRWLCIVPEGSTATEAPSAGSSQWRATTNVLTPKIQLYHDLAAGIAIGETHQVAVNVFLGDDDITSKVAAWKVTRNTGNEVEDLAWANKDKVKNFAGTLDIVWTNDEDDIGISDTGYTTFTFYATMQDGNLLTAELNFVS